MQKYYLYFIISACWFCQMVFFSDIVTAQIIDISKRTVSIEDVPVVFSSNACATLTNKTQGNLVIMWERAKEKYSNEEWESYIQDEEIEWSPSVKDGIIELAAHESADLCINFLTYAQPGDGEVLLKIYADADSIDILDSILFKINLDWPSIKRKNQKKKQVRVYPSMVRNHLYIDWNGAIDQVNKIEIYNLLGSPVAIYKGINTKQRFTINTSHLKGGVYFISIFKTSNQLLNTKAFSKLE